MQEVIFLAVLGFVWMVFAVAQDLKSREIANWLNFSLIIFALGVRFFYSLFEGEFMFFYQGLLGLGVFFVIGNLFYYGRLFAGGDAKLMIALGPILGFSLSFYENLKIFILFLLLFLLAGVVYGIGWSVYLSLRDSEKFKKEFFKELKKNKKLTSLNAVLGIFVMVGGFYEWLFFGLGFLILFFPYFYFYAKAIDKACMIKKVNVGDLTEGDWLVEDMKVGKGVVKASWEGIGRKEIDLLKKSYKDVLIKQGIPFSPVFLIAFLILVWIWISGNLDRVFGLF